MSEATSSRTTSTAAASSGGSTWVVLIGVGVLTLAMAGIMWMSEAAITGPLAGLGALVLHAGLVGAAVRN
jgi:hypothetical protein